MWIEKIVGDFADKKKYLQINGRLKALPPGYREAGKALARYLMYLGPSNDTDSLLSMLGDLAELLEHAAADGTPVRDLVGADPVAFAETFMANYGGGSWIRSEQSRLGDSIDDAVTKQSAAGEHGGAR